MDIELANTDNNAVSSLFQFIAYGPSQLVLPRLWSIALNPTRKQGPALVDPRMRWFKMKPRKTALRTASTRRRAATPEAYLSYAMIWGD